MTDLAPDDDAFIRTAIRGLRAPDHHPEFWRHLVADLDAMEGAAAPGQPLVAPLPQSAPEPERPIAAPHPPRREPLRAAPAGTLAVPVIRAAPAAPRPRAPVAAPARGPRLGPSLEEPELVVRHDPAVVPRSLRRGSNAVLLVVALVAAVVALIAGLTLVRERAGDGGSAPSGGSPEAVLDAPA